MMALAAIPPPEVNETAAGNVGAAVGYMATEIDLFWSPPVPITKGVVVIVVKLVLLRAIDPSITFCVLPAVPDTK